jgi:hypothetical protein
MKIHNPRGKHFLVAAEAENMKQNTLESFGEAALEGELVGN